MVEDNWVTGLLAFAFFLTVFSAYWFHRSAHNGRAISASAILVGVCVVIAVLLVATS